MMGVAQGVGFNFAMAIRGGPEPKRSKAAVAAALAASVLLGLAAVDLLFAVIVPLEGPRLSSAPGRAGAPALVADTSILKRVNLFASSDASLKPQQQDEELRETTLRLALKSASPSTKGGVSGAVIQTPSGDQVYFREGDEIIRGVTLSKVQTWRVVITRNGIREALTLMNRPQRDNMDEPLSAFQSKDGLVVVEEPEGTEAAGTEQQNIGAQPTGSQGGPTLGAIVGPYMAMFKSQGFQANDIPVAIDGQPVPQDQAGLQSFIMQARRRGTRSITLTITRDGQTRDITFSVP